MQRLGTPLGWLVGREFQGGAVLSGPLPPAGGDVTLDYIVPPGTLPVLSGVTVDPDLTTGTIAWSVDHGAGTGFWMIDQTGSRTAAEVVAGGGLDSGAQAVTAVGAQAAIAFDSLTAGTNYFAHLVYRDNLNNLSLVTTVAFATDAPPAAIPTYAGGSGFPTSAGNVTVSWPAGHQANDVGLLLLASRGDQPATQDLSASGWVSLGLVTESGAGTTARRQIRAWWKRATSAAETDVTMTDTGACNGAHIAVVRGCRTSGAPVALLDQDFGSAVANSFNIPGATPSGLNRLILAAHTMAVAATTSQVTGYTNASLANLTARLAVQAQPGGTGIGLYTATGERAAATAFGATAVGTVGATPDWLSALFEFIP